MASVNMKDPNVAQVVLASYKTIQELVKHLRVNEKDLHLKSFYSNVMVYCVLIHDHANRIFQASGPSHELMARLLDPLESAIRPGATIHTIQLPYAHQSSARLFAVVERLEELRIQNDNGKRLELLRWSLSFGATSDERSEFMLLLSTLEDELGARSPEETSFWATDELSVQKIREPSYDVSKLALSMYKALVDCKHCPCTPAHDFIARLSLGTYRKSATETTTDMDVDFDFNFDMFLSMKQDWQEARVRMTKNMVVQWAMNEKEQSRAKKSDPKNKPMRVKKLCEPIGKIKNMTTYRLELRVTKDRLFKLRSERSTSVIDKNQQPISLEHLLQGGSRSFTEKTRRILAVLLSSAVLHLHDTPWLQLPWTSANVLFLRTTSSAVPLKPFIQIPLLASECRPPFENFVGSNQVAHVADVSDTESNGTDPDDIDPDDLVGHQCPALVELAVMLIEVYFATSFNALAKRFNINLGEGMKVSSFSRYMDADVVFKKCKGEMPENTRFHYAVEKCLDPTLWEDEDGAKLDDQLLRVRIYEEIVRPLETELSQAYSSISIEDLDQFAQGLDFASWDQTIQTVAQEARPETIKADQLDTRQLFSPSPGPTTELHLRQPPELPTHQAGFDYKTSKFFDDETISDAHSSEARSNYSVWKSRYLEVYEKFIPAQSGKSPVAVAILDTGIDVTHPDVEARAENIKGKYNWVNTQRPNAVHDRNGHGTFTACLLLDYAPDAELYVSKIAENKPSSPRIVAEAINHAVEVWKVDIISMSFGFPSCDVDGYEEIELALKRAYANDVLLFAAASNSGGKLGRSYPAREPTVIAIHSTDANGNRSRFSPTAAVEDINLATIGEAVESSWPVHLCDEGANPQCVEYKSGTSYATPITAGIAAFLLLYVKIHLPQFEQSLRSQKRMKAVLRRIAERGTHYQPRDGYHFIDLSLYTDNLFGKDRSVIDMTIKELLRM